MTPIIFDYFQQPREVSDDLFDKLQNDQPILTISSKTRDAIRIAVADYEGRIDISASMRGSVSDRKQAERISKCCDELLRQMEGLRESNPLAANALLTGGVQFSYEDVKSRLAYYRRIFNEFAKTAKKGRVPRQSHLHRLLRRLAHFYRKSEGESTAVSGNRRTSDFIYFAWQIIRSLPTVKRPNGQSGLAEEWENCRAKDNAARRRAKAKGAAKKRRQKG